MKLSIAINLLIAMFTGLLATHTFATPQSEDQNTVNADQSKRVERLNEIRSLKELPEEINSILINKYGRVADINEKFNSSCVINFKEPSVGLKTATIGKDSATITVAIGGFTLRNVQLLFFKDDFGWHLQNNELVIEKLH